MNEFCSRVRKNTGNDNTLLFGLIADTHFEEKNNLAEYGANALAHMHAFAAAGKSCNARFLLHVGDMSNGNRPKVQSRREAALSAEALRSSGLPVLFVIGNHDDNTYFCRDNAPDGSEAISGSEWQNLVQPDGLPAGAIAAPEVSNCYYLDFPDQKVRLLILNAIDLPLETGPNGKLKYYSINHHGFSEAQLEFIVHKALNFSNVPDSEQWGILAVSHMALGFVLNGPALMKIFHAFQTGGRCRTGAEDVLPEAFLFDPNDLIHEIEADFSRQGPRELIALLCGHEHIDAVHSDHGYPEVSFLSSLCYRNSPEAPERRFGTAGEQAWSMVALNRTARRLNVFRYGAGNDFSVPY